MLINHIRVYQQADVEAITQQATGANNATGVGGPVPGSSSPRNDSDPKDGGSSANTTAKDIPDWEKTGGATPLVISLSTLVLGVLGGAMASRCLL